MNRVPKVVLKPCHVTSFILLNKNFCIMVCSSFFLSTSQAARQKERDYCPIVTLAALTHNSRPHKSHNCVMSEPSRPESLAKLHTQPADVDYCPDAVGYSETYRQKNNKLNSKIMNFKAEALQPTLITI